VVLIESIELVVQKEGSPDRVVDLSPGTIRIGRAEDNELVLADISVSRRHARLVVDGQGVKIEDLGSGNGTFFRGDQLQEQVLGDGDAVVIDPFVLKFHIQSTDTLAGPIRTPGARLLVTASDVMGPEAIVLPAGRATMGRSDECTIVLPDAAASRVHCSITKSPSGYQLLDESSANGIYVNGERIASHWLKEGDEVRIGDTFFQFQDTRMEQAHSVTDQQLNLSETGEETSWSKELTLPSPDNRLITDPRITAGEKKSKTVVYLVISAVVLLLALLLVLLVMCGFLVWMLLVSSAPEVAIPAVTSPSVAPVESLNFMYALLSVL
jgi:pSer/pThr/pTyr-binding forkhead associated (FHA) protein